MTKAAPDPTRQGLSPSVAEGARGRRHLPETVVRERTIADIAAGLAPGWRCQDIFAWPPDGFAFSSTVLSESGAYRLIVSPPRGKRWPPPDEVGGERWEEAVHDWAGEWASWAVVRHVQLANLDEPRNWTTLVALLTLHAMADEACAGLGLDRRAGDAFHEQAEDLLRENGTLSRFAGNRARVLPKSSLPRTGISIRSLSRHLSLDRSETEVRWYHSDAARSSPSLFKVLLVPYPARVAAAELHINNVAVRETFRGQGIGAALLRLALERAAEIGAERGFLEVRSGNTAAQALYRNCGFELVGQRPRYYSDPAEDALIMSVKLKRGA